MRLVVFCIIGLSAIPAFAQATNAGVMATKGYKTSMKNIGLTAEEARNVAVVTAYFGEVLDQGRPDLMPKYFDDGVVMHRPGVTLTGLKQIMMAFGAMKNDFTKFQSELSNVIAQGDLVSVRVTHTTEIPAKPVRTRMGMVDVGQPQAYNWTAIAQFKFRNGKIAEEWVERDEIGMYQQVGTLSITKRN